MSDTQNPEKRISLECGGVFVIKSAPKKFPLGERGKYPVQLILPRGIASELYNSDIPGVVVKANVVDTTWDVIPLLEREYVKEPLNIYRPKLNEVPLPGIERFRELKFHEKLWSLQKDAIREIVPYSMKINAYSPRCLSGDTEIVLNRNGNARRWSLKHIHEKLRGKATVNLRTGGESRWRNDVKSKTQFCRDDLYINLQEMVAVIQSGVKEVFEVVTARGHSIKATAEHQFKTSAGWKRLSELRVGDTTLTVVYPKQTVIKTSRPADPISNCWFHPYARFAEYLQKSSGKYIKKARVSRHRLVHEADINGLSFDEFKRRIRTGDSLEGLTFLDPKIYDVHHIDGNHKNNDPKNLTHLDGREHKRQHGIETHWKNVTAQAQDDKIISITAVGEEMTYDVVMSAEPHNFVANEFVVHNSGKSATILGALELVAAKKTLIICTALGRRVWAEYIAEWCQEEAVLLCGRACDEVRIFCKTCMGKRARTGQPKCQDCLLKNGQSRGYRIVTGESMVFNAINKARYIISNYDLISAQKAKDITGKSYIRDDLPGWASALQSYYFDSCVLDEMHKLRGWKGSTDKGSRRETIANLVAPMERVYGLTGTPIYGFVKDIWSLLDITSNGLWGKVRSERLPWAFGNRFCQAERGEYGWTWNGTDPRAETELRPRLMDTWMIQKSRKEIMKDQPPKTRQVIRLDVESDKRVGILKGGLRDRTAKAIQATADLKRDAVVENVITELATEAKVLVFTYHRVTAEKLFAALEKEIAANDNKTRMKQVNVLAQLVHGENGYEQRAEVASTFRSHDGAAVLVATIDSMPDTISLAGASSVHFADLHYQPEAMVQAENRPYVRGINGLHIVYYVVPGTIDDELEAKVVSKVTMLDKVVDEDEARELLVTFAKTAEESLAESWERLTAHLED